LKILVVDDHPIVRQGIAFLLSSQVAGARITGASSVEEALQCARRQPPDICILDLSLGRASGLPLIDALRKAGLSTPVLVLSVFDESLHAERALRAGAQGYLMKEVAPDLLVDAVQRVARGEVVVSPAVQNRLLAKAVGPATDSSGETALSDREREVLDLIGAGLSSQQIADKMVRSIKTIETHRSNLQRKLSLRSSLELVRYAALRQGPT
jgi:DNA-binding NarL/FixJ family response regulator